MGIHTHLCRHCDTGAPCYKEHCYRPPMYVCDNCYSQASVKEASRARILRIV
jgi:hypothetical protein